MELIKHMKLGNDESTNGQESQETSTGFNFLDIFSRFTNLSSPNVKNDVESSKLPTTSETTTVSTSLSNVLQKKELVPSTINKCTIEGVQFDVMGSTDISRVAELEIQKRELYYYLTNKPFPLGVLDNKLGCNRSDMSCETCGKGLLECVGHWGYIKLELPVFHVGFFKYIIQILYCICKKCSCLLLPDESISKLQEVHKRSIDDPLLKPLLFKRILQECRKITKCPKCNAPQGVIRRIVKPSLDQFMKLKHVVKYKEGGKMQTLEEELNPLVVRQLFEAIDPTHSRILSIVHPEKLIITNLSAPPNCIRPSVSIEGQGTTEDDLTCIFSDIVELNSVVRTHIGNGLQTNRFIGNWQFLQLQCTRLINAEAPAVSQLLASKNISKPGRGICQRLKGKEGRFRGNLSGKRVDFSARTVISPDPNVGIDEVVVPEWIARRLTFPERVNENNINILRKAIMNGISIWPGASYVHKLDGGKCSLRFANPKHIADNLQIGDIVERHLWNGDVVIFNRQPSLHRLSIMAHRSRVMKGSTFRFNECVCQPYNADFDGDEMNLHLPQTYEAKAESLHLLSVLKNLTTPKNGEPLIAAVQDFLSASYLLTSKDRFITRKQICQICCYFTDSILHIDLPPPAIIYPVMLWTGKQIFNLLLRPNKNSKVIINFECKEREFQGYTYKHTPPEVTPTESNTTSVPLGVEASSNYLSLKSKATPGDRGDVGDSGDSGDKKHYKNKPPHDLDKKHHNDPHNLSTGTYNIKLEEKTSNVVDATSSGEPAADLREAEGEVNREADGRNVTSGVSSTECDKIVDLHPCMCPKDGYVIFHHSELICGSLGTKSLGACKNGLFYQLLTKNNSHIAAECMLRLSKLASRWLPDFGMTIGLDDVTPSAKLIKKKKELLHNGYINVTNAIKNFKNLQTYPGCTQEETLELQVKHILDELRNEAGKICNSNLNNDNKPLIMFNSGAKGSLINIAQMISCVGQQNVSGQRIQNGFIGRTLPHFNINCKDAKSRGFVANSFFSGLEPEEFFFHTMSGREGLIDTAVKTSETGYMQRRLMKVMEDLAICYDHTVRTSDGQVIQFLYGDDGLSSSLLMSDVDMYRSLQHIISTNPICKRNLLSLRSYDNTFELYPPNDIKLLMNKVDLIIENDLIINNMPHQLKNKVKTYRNWSKEPNNNPIDNDTCQQLKKNVAAYISVYHDTNNYHRNLPLFPDEINKWTTFLQPLLKELLPNAIQHHLNLSHNEKPTHQDGTHEILFYGDTIANTLYNWSKKLEEYLKYDYTEMYKEYKNSKMTLAQFRLNKICTKYWLSIEQIFQFIRSCWRDYQKGVCEPGEAIGALGAQSIGEPGTQMTLKTFHFAGVASMNVTLGVPRIKEIINAATCILTPIIEVPLINKNDYNFAMAIKARIEKTTLGQICNDIRELYASECIKLIITLNSKLIQQLFLNINAEKIRDVIIDQGTINKIKLGKQNVHVLGKWQLCIDLPSTQQQFFQQHTLISGLLELVIAGNKNVKRAVIKKEQSSDGYQYQIAIEGYGLQEIMGSYGVEYTAVKSNHVIEVAKVLGIEAARSVIISEIQKCMDAYSIDIDGRYMKLLGDVMTFRGEVIGINRFGIQKMRASTLMLASFEETNEHLFEAAVHHRKDPIKGVSECIIMGKPISLGTGSFDILLKT